MDMRSMPRLTMRSHLRLSSASSASCIASWERSSRHLDSFWAMNCSRSACFSVSVNGPLSALGDCTSTDPRLRLSPFPPGVPLALGPRDKLRLSEGAATIVGDRRSHVGALSLGKYEMDDWRRDALMLRAVGGGVESPDIVGEGHEDVEGEALAGTLPSTSCNGLGPDNESGRVDSRGELIIVGTRSELPT